MPWGTVPLALLVSLCAFLATGAAQVEDSMPKPPPPGPPPRPTISVSGHGEISTRPDIVEITLGVHTRADTALVAARQNGEVMNRILSVCKERGIAEKDVQTARLNVSPQYNQPTPGSNAEYIPRVVGYTVDNQVRVILRKLDSIAEVLDAVMNAGANQVSGIAFRVEQPEKLSDEARKRAMADAKRKATILAGEAGVILGHPRSIVEHDDRPIMGGPMFRTNAMMAAPAPALPVAPGEEKLSVSVSVVYELVIPK